MKVAYIAPFRDGSGYSHSAIDHILSLDSVGVTVVPRAVQMTPTKGEVPDRIKELEDNDLNNVDVVIQHNLPSEFVYKGGVQNIGLFAYETNGFPNSLWKDHLELMDKVVVSCAYQKAAVHRTCGEGLGKRTHVLLHPVDCSKFDREHETMFFDTPENTTKFYTISEFGRRKNLVALFTAYYSAFSVFDNVILIVKTHLPNRNSEEATKVIGDLCLQLKKDLARFKDESYYPKIALMTDYMPNKHINSLHATGDVFVTASHGEAICLPFLDALGFGNPAIVPYYSSFPDYYVDKDLVVDSNESVVFGVPNAPPGIYTADEKWGNISLPHMVEVLRYANEHIAALKDKNNVWRRQERVNDLSYQKVGQRLKDIIDAK